MSRPRACSLIWMSWTSCLTSAVNGPVSDPTRQPLCIRSLRLPPNEQSRVERRITVRPPAERPTLEGEPIVSVSTDDGLPVHAALPTLRLPVGDFDESQWVVKGGRELQVDHHRSGTAPEVGEGRGLHGLVPEDEPCIVGLVVQGPLGADLRTTFAFAPGLEVEEPGRLLFHDPAGGMRRCHRGC